MKLSEIKAQTGLTTEEILAITEQPDPNCPLLDSYREDIERHLVSHHVSQETHNLLNSLIEMVELMRGNCEALRNWGQDWKDMAKLMMEDHDLSFISEQVYQKLKGSQPE